MHPSGKPGELFKAFSRITAKAFSSDRLLSCPTLSKAPNYGDVLRRYLTKAPINPRTLPDIIRLAARYCLANGGEVLFMLLVRLYIGLLGWRLPPPLGKNNTQQSTAPLLVIDTFALLPGIATKGRFDEGYMPSLWEEAKAHGKFPVRLYRLYGSRNPSVVWNAMKTLSSTGEGCTEAHLLTWKDWGRVCLHCLAYPFALWRLIRSLDDAPQDSPEAYIRDALLSTAGQNIVTGEVRRLAGYRLGLLCAPGPQKMSSVPSPQTAAHKMPMLITWYENQTVNKAFHRGLHQALKKTNFLLPSIGAQLFVWPDTLLNNHPDDGEANLGLTPDIVLVNGPYFLPEHSRQAYEVGPSLRYKDLFKGPVQQNGEESAPDSKNTGKAMTGSTPMSSDRPLLALLSYHPDETKRVLELLLPLSQKGQNIHYRFHPATQPSAYASLLPKNPIMASGPLSDVLNNASAVIGAASGSLAEAAALGVPVLTVTDTSGIPGVELQYLPPLGKGLLWDTASTEHEVEPALGRLLAFKNTEKHRELTQELRTLLFTDPTPEAIGKAFRLQ